MLWNPSRRFVFPLLSLACLASGLYAQYAGAEPPPADLKRGFDAVKIEDAKAILGFLAGPECQGRGSGQPGFQKAADFVAARFKEYGLKPMGDNGTYFQNVPFTRTHVDANVSGLKIGSDTILKGLRTSTRGTADLNADVVFLRVTGESPKLENADILNGKIVVLSGATIPQSIRTQVTLSDAVALLTVNPKAGPSINPGSVRPGKPPAPTVDAETPFKGLIRAEVSTEEAKSLAKAEGVSESAVSFEPGTGDTVAVENGTKQANLTLKVVTEEVGVPNVVGMLEGSDPTMKAEYVGIGGHLDHLGVNGAGVVYPGADDDGSGSTAVMLVAKAFHDSKTKPKRSIIFMTFCGEEMGLIGSGYLSNNPTFPLDKMIAEFQMDMVGRDSEGVQNGDRNRVDVLSENIETIRLVGSQRISTELHTMILDLNRYVNFKFKYDAEDVYTRSDHYNFARKGIPIAFLFDGFHPDYHQPTDTVDKIDFVKIVNSAKLYFMAVVRAADREKNFVHDVPQNGGGDERKLLKPL